MLSDQTLARLLAFREERDWAQFHTFRNLAVSISLEAAELLEFVQWVDDADMPGVVADRRADISDEIADIAMYLAFIAHDMGLDIDECVRRKLGVNEQRYPVDKARGVATKYDRLK
jgi:NTP pyrophosphatase (non-canonical NTP hydrolase)